MKTFDAERQTSDKFRISVSGAPKLVYPLRRAKPDANSQTLPEIFPEA